MRKTYLGKLWLHWCTHCNVPVLSRTCSTCNNSTIELNITPPGDIRPAFTHDIDFINEITTKQFGKPLIPKGKLVVLNKAPYEDRMDEVIFDGHIMGSLRFEIEPQHWRFLSRIEGAARLFQENNRHGMKNWVIIDNSAVSFIRNGASTLAPGVINADLDIKTGDEVVVLSPDNEVVSCGRARMNGREMVEAIHGVAVKTRWHGTPENTPLQDKKTWDDAIVANKAVLDSFTGKALNFINNVAETTNLPIAVSYSGGKDSLATLLLVKDAGVDFDMLFVDTGLEFPETIQNVKDVSKEYNTKLLSASAGTAFWESVEYFGPPSVETRWCCKICKLGPITQLIEKHYPAGCLTFIGQRKYESSARSQSEHVWKNPWIGNQVGASPIQNWTALHIWLYLFAKKAPHNPLYEQGFTRIGCWLCPSTSMSDLIRISKSHPKLWNQYTKVLQNHAEKLGLGKGWIEYHLWRWQNPPKTHRELAKKLKITIKATQTGTPDHFSLISGYRPCTQGGVTVEAAFNTPLNLEKIEKSGMLRCIGNVNSMDGVLNIQVKDHNTQIFASGNITSRGKNEEDTTQHIENIATTIKRALNCKGCGLCAGQCNAKSIKIKNKKAIITKKCTACNKCNTACPITKFIA